MFKCISTKSGKLLIIPGMPRGYPPTVFFSSTCYDLAQIRRDLKSFVESIGLEAMLSETPEFPVDPQLDTISNCTRVVRERADIFVLIVGGRYGYQTKTGHSITNLEYLEARAKNIPIYVFIAKNVLITLPIWKDNKDGNYTNVVDTTKLFEFADELRNITHWVFPFEQASDISAALKEQLPCLFMDGLLARQRLQDAGLHQFYQQLPPDALRIVLEKPWGWQFYFTEALLRAEFEALQDIQNDIRFEIRLGPVEELELGAIASYLQRKFAEAMQLGGSLANLWNTAINEAIGNSGASPDPQLIAYVCKRLKLGCGRLLEWKHEILAVRIEPRFQKALRLVADMPNEFIDVILSIPKKLDIGMKAAEEARRRGEQAEVTLMFKPEIANLEEVLAEIGKITDELESV